MTQQGKGEVTTVPFSPHQLHRLLIHADNRTLRIRRFGIGFQHFLHAGREFGVGLGRNHPILYLATCHPIFLTSDARFHN
jgi:hypothetical protein